MTTTALTPSVDLRRASDRFSTDAGGSTATTLPSATTGPAQHPLRAAAGQQRRRRRPGTGFETHPTATWRS